MVLYQPRASSACSITHYTEMIHAVVLSQLPISVLCIFFYRKDLLLHLKKLELMGWLGSTLWPFMLLHW